MHLFFAFAVQNCYEGQGLFPSRIVHTHLLRQLLGPNLQFLDCLSHTTSLVEIRRNDVWLEEAAKTIRTRASNSNSIFPKGFGIRALMPLDSAALYQTLSTFPVPLTHLSLYCHQREGRREGIERILQAHYSSLVHLDLLFPWLTGDKPEGETPAVRLPRLPRLATLVWGHAGSTRREGVTQDLLDGLGLREIIMVNSMK